jgi:acyl-CoA thioesterase-1
MFPGSPGPGYGGGLTARVLTYGDDAGRVQRPTYAPVHGTGGFPGRLARCFAFIAAGLVLLMSIASTAVPAWAAERPLRVVALGDSLTAGYQLPASAAFPAVLEKELKASGVPVEIANAGVSGDTASQGLARLDWSVPVGSDAVIVALGANDALRGLDPAGTRRALDQIVSRLKARGIAVMLAGMYAPRNLGADYIRSFDSIYPELAAKYGVPLYPFFLDGIVGDPKYNLSDRMHPNPEGVRIMVSRILPAVQAFLGSLAKSG